MLTVLRISRDRLWRTGLVAYGTCLRGTALGQNTDGNLHYSTTLIIRLGLPREAAPETVSEVLHIPYACVGHFEISSLKAAHVGQKYTVLTFVYINCTLYEIGFGSIDQTDSFRSYASIFHCGISISTS
jgi:hypothetical protein